MSKNIGIILGSTRTDSLGRKIFDYLKSVNQNTNQTNYTWIDLKDYPLPLYDHTETPLESKIHDLNDQEAKWLQVLEEQDGYIIMTPEYNHAITGALKNALDYVGPQVERKPVSVIAYSHFSDGGVLAAESIMPILRMFSMIVMPKPALLWNVDPNFTDDGKLVKSAENSDHYEKRLAEMFTEIDHYTEVLKNNPYQG
ncbi:NADPH-dependent FMN reductase [Companilactobacillus zhongbaensis]|uniref:NADPH-dependent FMN reductase n=1 Tax=Companilactobacillus zhongbaensis TaxID=2486009 RepID=UPI000F76A864|nr:NAD(P)H-dependent oxidoreductase [Companilactobacillus zhongbaensis]